MRPRSIIGFLSVVGLALLTTATATATRDVTGEGEALDGGSESAPQLLQVKIYYEALCGDSMQFIRRHLYPAMMGNGWLKNTDLQFVPYGKVTAWTDPDTNVTSLYCQHGDAECELNALHACIVEHNSVEEQLKMIHCLMRGFSTDVDQCSASLGIDVSAARNCKASRSTPDILRKYGDDTDAIDISFVPSIAMDGVFNRSEQRKILYSFARVFCSKYGTKYGITLDKC